MMLTPDDERTDERTAAVLLERRGPVAVLTLNRPEQANTFNAALLRDLHHATELITGDPRIHVVLLTGAGRHFSGGADLRENRAERRESRRRYRDCADLSRLPQPVIAAINGPALGGGCEIALTCDFRFMSADAQIGLSEIRFGALPRGGGTARLPKVVGLPWATKLIMTGEPVDAARAQRIGLVDEVVAPGELLAATEEFARHLAERPGYALRAAKRLLNRTVEAELAEALAAERRLTTSMATREERDAARLAAMRRMPTYARIFNTYDRKPGVRSQEAESA